MLKTLGVILLMGGCIGISLGKIKVMDGRINILRSFLCSLEVIEREIEFRLSPMEQMLKSAAQGSTEPVVGLLLECSAELRSGNGYPFSEIWCRLVKERLYLLKKPDLDSILLLGGIFGKYDSRGQQQAICHVRSVLTLSLSDALAERKNQGKVYCTLGATVGALLVILLL